MHLGHECFLPTAAEDVMKSMTHSNAVSDGVTDDGINSSYIPTVMYITTLNHSALLA